MTHKRHYFFYIAVFTTVYMKINCLQHVFPADYLLARMLAVGSSLAAACARRKPPWVQPLAPCGATVALSQFAHGTTGLQLISWRTNGTSWRPTAAVTPNSLSFGLECTSGVFVLELVALTLKQRRRISVRCMLGRGGNIYSEDQFRGGEYTYSAPLSFSSGESI